MTGASRSVQRVALFGLPGAGKSTAAGLLRRTLAGMDRHVEVIKLAAPLYDVQAAFYARARTRLAEGQQDGELLNFLGSHFRTAAPGLLLEDFAQRAAAAELAGADVLLCDDARPADLDGLRDQGFTLVRVTAPDALRRERKAGRGDRRAGRDDHPTELGGDGVEADLVLDNAGDLPALEEQVVELAKRLPAAPAEQEAAEQVVASLVGLAREVITERYAENRHQIGAVVVTGDGRVFTGIHLEAMVGRASVCAEAVALGQARAAGAGDLMLALAVRHPKPSEERRDIKLVPPCGLCRELLLDYGPRVSTVVQDGDEMRVVPLASLLPHKYVGTKWPTR
ncbi:cytidine deaminase [Streptomyces sp. DSM 42041]|uniref:Cytidine deaminase n=1 Tax=Streptomyces hazeniae TaxID=3075538 RepID=A0ABU2NWE4_9ACTN|nr:cytidine deaminase [Streptomyces sp. DSM 42041]MDT0381312.1 cytidine deaminase [Streptomyces sp. DSM 42041]